MSHLIDSFTEDRNRIEATRLEQIQQRLQQRLHVWRDGLMVSGLDGVVEALLGAGAPLGPLGAQLLWLAQPALGVLLPPNAIDDLAQLLNDPAGVLWLQETLTGSSEAKPGPDNARVDTQIDTR